MKEPSIYGQTHRMNWIFWITLPIIAGSTLLGLFFEAREQHTTLLELSWSDSESLTGIIMTVLVLFLLKGIKLKWEFNSSGFEYHFIPFIWRNKIIPFSEIQHISFEKIHALKDFGGWGYRVSRKKGKAYTTGGNTVIRIQLTQGTPVHLTATSDEQLDDWITYFNEKYAGNSN
jgi:hypothetical protein